MKRTTLKKANQLTERIEARQRHVKEIEERVNYVKEYPSNRKTSIEFSCTGYSRVPLYADFLNEEEFLMVYLMRVNSEISVLEKQLADLQDAPSDEESE